MISTYHVYPEDDAHPHSIAKGAGTSCECAPVVQEVFASPNSKRVVGRVIVHNRFMESQAFAVSEGAANTVNNTNKTNSAQPK